MKETTTVGNVTAWKCEVCGYVHEGPEPPDVCPVCGVEAELFSPMEPPATSADAGTSDTLPAEPPEVTVVKAWRCTVCGYIHEGPEPPDTCPVCDVDSSLFEPVVTETPKASEDIFDGDRVLIIGGGVGGLMAAEQAREQSHRARITLIAKEQDLPYYRINLSRALAAEVTIDSLLLKPASWFSEQHIDVVHQTVSSIDRDAKTLTFKDGSSVPYDKLVLANGAHPFLPPFPGLKRRGVHVLRTMEDTRTLLAATENKTARCVVVGGGLLGLEAAAALERRGAHVTVLEGFDWLLPRQLAQPAGDMLQASLESKNFVVRTGVHVKELDGDEDVRAVILDDGEQLPADVVVIATGVRPNKYLAMQCGLEVRRGVVVDDAMQTSDPSIYAAGDVAEHSGIVPGLWPIAMAQGKVAGANAAGGKQRYRAISPSNQLKVVDIDIVSIGDPHAHDGSYDVFERTDGDNYLRVVCHDSLMVGVNLVGDTSLGAALRDAIENKIPLSELGGLTRGIDGFMKRCTNES